ncbi:Phragmoplastin interacting protein 1 [Cardamine amara subsp. amara]|uniref:Phragmoplastin interacting protein 1 n=1 Tax=Cardamine amara subsp. amara TaxID=228776 RepID=A0ABD0ZKV5_CARAN
MVLSNKKLKQKIREDLVKSLSVSVAETNPDSVSNLQSQSQKELFDSASHKPRFSKREKRRKSETCATEDQLINGIREKEVENGAGSSQKTDKKKRKRDEEEGTKEGELEGDEGTTKEGENPKKKKKKKKKNKERKAKKDNAEDKVKVEEIQVNTENKEKEEGGFVPKKLYVGGIPYQSTEDEIRSYFRSCGVITKVDCKMRPEDGAFTGIAFITFESEDGAKRALAFDRAAMGDRYLTIQQYVKTTPSIPRRNTSSGFAPEMVDGYNRVYIGNLAWDTTERDIRKLFSDCVITSMRLGKNKETGEFKGYAHVDFKDSVSLAIALKQDQHVIGGRAVKICCALKDRPAANNSTDPTPNETNNMEETYAAADSIPAFGNYFTPTVSNGKIKRRVCFECGEKGHLSTACPKKLQNADDQANSKLVDAGPAKQSYGLSNYYGDSYYMNDRYAATDEANNGSFASAVSTGKVKRRSCYECGEKGHLSTACPKKLQNTAHTTNQKLDYQTVETGSIQVTSYSLEKNARDTENNGVSYMYATNGGDDGNFTATVSTGKVKRRSCYECGEKGHLSTACPKKLQNTAHTNQNQKLDYQTAEAGPIQVTSYSFEKNARDNENNGVSYMDETYATNGANDGNLTATVSTGKIKRRSCYECGEKGHLSSACPKKQQKQG